jgi:hypothetical protein
MRVVKKKRDACKVLIRKPEGKSLLATPNCRLDSSVSEYGKVVSSCEHGNKTAGSINCGKFCNQLNNYKLLKDSAPWS